MRVTGLKPDVIGWFGYNKHTKEKGKIRIPSFTNFTVFRYQCNSVTVQPIVWKNVVHMNILIKISWIKKIYCFKKQNRQYHRKKNLFANNSLCGI